MRQEQVILLVWVWKQTADYFFSKLTFGGIKSSLSHSLGQGFFTWRSLSHHIQKYMEVLNCFFVHPYWKILRHYLACVCVPHSVWCLCACVCCKILAARITFHVCVCVWQRGTLSPREYSRTQKRENSHSMTQKIEPNAAARHPCLGYCAPHEIRISIQWIC